MQFVAVVLLFTITLASCASQGPSTKPAQSSGSILSAQPPQIPDGRWLGRMQWTATVPVDGQTGGTLTVRIDACNGKAQVSVSPDGVKFSTPPVAFAVVSSIESHLIYFLSSSGPIDPSWVEIQAWSLTERAGGYADIQWSRAVNNRKTPMVHVDRTFGQQGRGEVRRVSDTCSDAPVKNRAAP